MNEALECAGSVHEFFKSSSNPVGSAGMEPAANQPKAGCSCSVSKIVLTRLLHVPTS
jgi:hypothetical protein